MGIIVKQHDIDLNRKTYFVTITDSDDIVVDGKNIGCETKLNANGDVILDAIEASRRVKNIVAKFRANKITANVDIDLG